MGQVADRITEKLTQAFAPTELTVSDESHLHAGHSGARPEGETHFRVKVVSKAFAGKTLEQDLEHTRRWVDYYALLGAPAIRIFAGQPNSSEAMQVTLDRCAKNCEIACRYAADKGIMLALENHGGVTAQAEGLLNIVKQVQSPAFGINFDSGNFRTDKDPYAELQAIAPYAINAQIKVEMTQDGKTVETDLERVLGILRDAGYSGWVALEYEADEEPIEAIPRWLEKLKKLIDA